MLSIALFAGLFLLGGMVGCAAKLDAPIRSGLLVEREALVSGLETICPFHATTALSVGDEAAKKEKLASLDRLLAAEFERIGLRVVEASRVNETWEKLKREAGGFYDEVWGRVQEEKRRGVLEQFFVAVEQELGCDAVAYAGVVPVEAPYWNGAARWDHATWSRSFPVVGWLPALSFELILETDIDREIYYGVGGIGMRVKRAAQSDVEIFDNVEPEALLTGEETNLRGIRRSLAELEKALTSPQ